MRVIDITAMVMGPYCPQIMAEMGADVIKVEPPRGDDTRYWPPDLHCDEAMAYDPCNDWTRVDNIKLYSRLLCSKATSNAPGTTVRHSIGDESKSEQRIEAALLLTAHLPRGFLGGERT